MDRRIENLKSTTFGGRRFTRKQIATIQETVNTFSTLSRRELAHTICEHLRLYTPKGKNKIQSCLRALDSLEALGILSLPEKVESKKRGPQKTITWTTQTEHEARKIRLGTHGRANTSTRKGRRHSQTSHPPTWCESERRQSTGSRRPASAKRQRGAPSNPSHTIGNWAQPRQPCQPAAG